MLNILLNSHNLFKNKINNTFIETVKIFCEKLITIKKAYQAIELLKQILKISEKMQFNMINLLELMAKAYEQRIIEMNKTFATINFCLNAIEIYKNLKNHKKVEELTCLYEEITKGMKFGGVTIPVDVEPLIQESRAQAEELKNITESDLFILMAFDKLFIPDEKFIINQAEQIKQQGFIMSMLVGNINIFDQRGNLIKTCSSEDDKFWHEMMKNYRFLMQFKTFKLNIILEELIKNEKLKEEIIYKYIENDSWISYTFENSLAKEYNIKYSYKNMVKKLINEYFKLFMLMLDRKITSIDIFIFIDSFTLRFEGLIRALFDIQKFPTVKPDYKTGTVMEKDLNGLLRDENIKYLFDSDEVLFFKFLFIEQEGFNLRNKVAHSLLLEFEYNFDLINLLFIALLRVLKISFVKNDEL